MPPALCYFCYKVKIPLESFKRVHVSDVQRENGPLNLWHQNTERQACGILSLLSQSLLHRPLTPGTR